MTNQISTVKKTPEPAPFTFALNNNAAGSINYLLFALKTAMKNIVKEAMEEVLIEQGYKSLDEDRTLTARELCERWSISANTLRNWEIDGKIAPLPIKGRKKIYSMKDVLAVEVAGYIKNII